MCLISLPDRRKTSGYRATISVTASQTKSLAGGNALLLLATSGTDTDRYFLRTACSGAFKNPFALAV